MAKNVFSLPGVYFLDIFMDNHRITADRLHLVAFVSLLIAIKIEERESKIPKIAELSSIVERSGFKYPAKDFRALERKMLGFMDFGVRIPTAATFCEYFMHVVVAPEDRLKNNTLKKDSYHKHLRSCARKMLFDFLDLSLSDCNLAQDTPSKVAATCILATRRQLKLIPLWPIELYKITKYTYNDMEETLTKLMTLHYVGPNKPTPWKRGRFSTPEDLSLIHI